MTKTVPAAEFEENVHALLEDVSERGDEVLLTKDGRAFAKLVPIHVHRPNIESLRGSAVTLGDIVSPAFDEDEWDVNK